MFEHFLEEYKAGRTPNPDILCNKEIKFWRSSNLPPESWVPPTSPLATMCAVTTALGRPRLLRGLDNNKDQSYFLYTLSEKPGWVKPVPGRDLENRGAPHRRAARPHHRQEEDSPVSALSASASSRTSLAKFLPAQPGPIETVDGKVIQRAPGADVSHPGPTQRARHRRHEGCDRRSLVRGGQRGGAQYVVVAQGEHPRLYSDSLIASQLHWGIAPRSERRVAAPSRPAYRQQDVPCLRIQPIDDETIRVIFDEKQAAVTPGQSAVFYDGEVCSGGGIIEQRFSHPV